MSVIMDTLFPGQSPGGTNKEPPAITLKADSLNGATNDPRNVTVTFTNLANSTISTIPGTSKIDLIPPNKGLTNAAELGEYTVDWRKNFLTIPYQEKLADITRLEAAANKLKIAPENGTDGKPVTPTPDQEKQFIENRAKFAEIQRELTLVRRYADSELRNLLAAGVRVGSDVNVAAPPAQYVQRTPDIRDKGLNTLFNDVESQLRVIFNNQGIAPSLEQRMEVIVTVFNQLNVDHTMSDLATLTRSTHNQQGWDPMETLAAFAARRGLQNSNPRIPVDEIKEMLKDAIVVANDFGNIGTPDRPPQVRTIDHAQALQKYQDRGPGGLAQYTEVCAWASLIKNFGGVTTQSSVPNIHPNFGAAPFQSAPGVTPVGLEKLPPNPLAHSRTPASPQGLYGFNQSASIQTFDLPGTPQQVTAFSPPGRPVEISPTDPNNPAAGYSLLCESRDRNGNVQLIAYPIPPGWIVQPTGSVDGSVVMVDIMDGKRNRCGRYENVRYRGRHGHWEGLGGFLHVEWGTSSGGNLFQNGQRWNHEGGCK